MIDTHNPIAILHMHGTGPRLTEAEVARLIDWVFEHKFGHDASKPAQPIHWERELEN